MRRRLRLALLRLRGLDLDDIQGWVLRLYDFGHSASLFARVDDPDLARSWLREHVDELTSVKSFRPERDYTLNVAFTATGLTALGATSGTLAKFPPAFQDGMAKRAEKLGDIGQSEPTYWPGGLGTGQAHMLVTVHIRREGDVDAVVERFENGLEASGMSVIYTLRADRLTDGREHFGFSDGFSQPAVAGVRTHEHRRGQGTPGKRSGEWRPLAPGEFVLGYVDEDGVVPGPAPEPFHRNSSFMVWRQLDQDVGGFYRYCDERFALFPGGADEVAARMVGRWRDGTPLALSPNAADPRIAGDPDQINDFRYGDDPEGRRCPVGSHARRTNPRDALGIDGRLTRRHRIIRRGMSYGPPAEDPRKPEKVEGGRGLAFVCFQADLERQFETVQAGWCADGDAFGLDTAKDPILANDDPNGVFVAAGAPPVFLGPYENFVTAKGGEYLIAPGIDAVLKIADGTAW